MPRGARGPWRRATALLACCGAVAAHGEDLEFDSVYAHYILRKHGSVVEMHHRSRETDWLESAVDLNDPVRQVVPYTRLLFGGVFFKEPERVLMIGLGGGGFHRLFSVAFTNSLLQTVEIDRMALRLATEHMGFRETPRNVVTIEDGRRFVKKTQVKWDWVILDAFHGGDVPFHLKTREFYREIARVLSTNGVMISNLHRGSELFHSDVKTLVNSFSQAVFLQTPGRANVIAVAADYRSPLLSDQLRRTRESRLPAGLRRYVNLSDVPDTLMDPRPDAEEKGRVLTDDFAPTEYYNSRPE